MGSLFWGSLFGTVGFSYFLYGRKQSSMSAVVCGLLLMVYPYAVSNTLAVVLIGLVLMAVPFYLRD